MHPWKGGVMYTYITHMFNVLPSPVTEMYVAHVHATRRIHLSIHEQTCGMGAYPHKLIKSIIGNHVYSKTHVTVVYL